MSDSEPSDPNERCQVATSAALDAALNECSDGAVLFTIANMMGLEDTPDPAEMPVELDEVDCMKMATVRPWVATRAAELVKDGEGMSESISQAWSEAAEMCGW